MKPALQMSISKGKPEHDVFPINRERENPELNEKNKHRNDIDKKTTREGEC
jgi:hypothetical protein